MKNNCGSTAMRGVWRAMRSFRMQMGALLLGLVLAQGLLMPTSASAAATVLTAWASKYEGITGPANVAAQSVAAGSDRLYLVAVGAEYAAATTTFTVTASLNTVGVTQLVSTAGTSTRQHLWIGYIKHASIPAAAGPLAVSISGTATGMQVRTAAYQGVIQTATTFNASTIAYTAAANPVTTAAVAYLDQGAVFLVADTGTGGAITAATSTGFTQAQLYPGLAAYFGYWTANKTTTTGGGSVPVGTAVAFTGATSTRSTIAVVALNPAPTGSTTTLATGTDPGSLTLAPGASATNLDAFTLQGTVADTVTAATVTLAATPTNTPYNNISLVELTNAAGTVVYGSVANPASNTVNFTGMTLPVTTSAVTFYVRVTPKTAALMPAVPGASYATTGTVTAYTCTGTKAGTDGASATLTIDNASPAAPTLFTGTAGNNQVALTWTNPVADFNSVVILRKGSAITEVPVEGTTYAASDIIGGTATVVYVGPLAAYTDPAPNGTGYFYKIFAKDAYGNYSSTGMAAGPYTPTGPTTTVGNGTNPGPLYLKPGDPLNSLDAFTLVTSIGTESITTVTVSLSSGSATGIEQIAITDAAGTVTYGTLSNPLTDTPTVSTAALTATTTVTNYLVRIKPKTHVNMPAPPGSLYTVSGTVTALNAGNTKVYSDTGSAVIEIDNASTDVATWGVITPGDTVVDLSWANPADPDLDPTNSVVVLRKANAAVTEVPTEGAAYAVDASVGAAIVRYVGPVEGFIDTGLPNNTNDYYYAIFAKDINGNYSLGSTTGPHRPWIPVCVTATPTLTITPATRKAIPTDVAKYTVSVKSNDNYLCPAADFTLSLSDSNSVDFTTPSVLSATVLNLAPGVTKQSTLTVSVKGTATLNNINVTTINVAAAPRVAPAAVTATTMAANPLMHNSKTTASTKWGAAGWGITGGKYGTFNCFICHEESTFGENGTPNVKKIRQTIVMPADANPATMWPNGSKTSPTLTFDDTRAGSSSYADSNSAHSTSSRVCESCHTYQGGVEPNNSGVRNHAYNMSGATTDEQSHNALGDCLTCHPHNGGFKAQGCTVCHGNPLLIAADLSFAPATGSTSIGAHPKHNSEAFDCDYCHGAGSAVSGGGALHNQGKIYIEFTGFGQLEANDGTYKGGLPASMPFGYLGNDAAAVDGSLSCATVYCHGGTIYPALPAPTWTGTAACGSCHNDVAADTGWLGSHADHLSATGANLGCSACHGAGYTAGTTKPAGHLNGQVKIDLGSYGTYSKVANGGQVPTLGLPAAVAYGNCTVSCHGAAATSAWGTDFGAYPAKCTKCHNDGTAGTALINAVPSATKTVHTTHVNANNIYVPTDCDACHGANASLGTHASHSGDGAYPNGTATYANLLSSYNSTTKDCANTCHVATTDNLWVAAPPALACLDCHSSTYIGGNNATTGFNTIPTSGLHNMSAAGVTKHDATLAGGGCAACHVTEDTVNHMNGAFVADGAANNDRWVNRTVNGGMTYAQILPTSGRSGSCSGTTATGLTGCHSDAGKWARLWSTEANVADTTVTVGNAKCNVCHGQWASLPGSAGWAAGTTHANAGATKGSGHEPATPNCDACHVYASGSTRHDTTTHLIDYNSNTTTFARDGSVYGTSKAGCSQCHGGAADAAYNFPISSFSPPNPVFGTPIPPPPCNSCHDNAGKAATVPQVKIGTTAGSSSSHVDADGPGGATKTIDVAVPTAKCENCHAGHADAAADLAGDVEISTYSTRLATTVPSLNWPYAAHGNKIQLGGTTADRSTSATAITEAEMCWACHDSVTPKISEWSYNTHATTKNSNYDYGDLYTNNNTVPGTAQSNWTTGFWRSGKGRHSNSGTNPFWYKRGAIQSTHSANFDSGTAALTTSGNSLGFGRKESVDAVANIRCTYCHDVHGTHNGQKGDTSGGAGVADQPYLRGTWKGNPYPEDGAPQLSMNSWTLNGLYGLVPRTSASPTNNGKILTGGVTQAGGWWIDQNSNNPNSRASGATVHNTSGLCEQCHGTNKTGTWATADFTTLDWATTGADALNANWISGYNGHANSVLNGPGRGAAASAESYARNIFTRTKRGTSTLVTSRTRKTAVEMGLASDTAVETGYSYRDGAGVGYGWTPNAGAEDSSYRAFAWGTPAAGASGRNSIWATGTQAVTWSATSPEPANFDSQANYHTFTCSKCHNPHASRLPKLMITNCLDTNHNTWEDLTTYTGTALVAPFANTRHSQWGAAINCHRTDARAALTTGQTVLLGRGWNRVTPWLEFTSPNSTRTTITPNVVVP